MTKSHLQDSLYVAANGFCACAADHSWSGNCPFLHVSAAFWMLCHLIPKRRAQRDIAISPVFNLTGALQWAATADALNSPDSLS